MQKFTIFSGLLFFTAMAMAHQTYMVISPDESRTLVEIPQDMQDLGEDRRRQIKEKGYFSENVEFVSTLLAFKDKKGTTESMIESDPYFKILRLNMADFSLSFPFDGFPSIVEKNLLGFVPSGSYLDKTKQWTGLTAFFMPDEHYVCRMTIFDMQSMNGQSIYDSRFASFDINKKPTFISASGSPESGFLYEASWTGERYEKMLECVNKKPFDRNNIRSLVTLAKKLDGDLPDNP